MSEWKSWRQRFEQDWRDAGGPKIDFTALASRDDSGRQQSATRDWLIALSVVTGLAMCIPRMIAFDLFGADRDADRAARRRRRAGRWSERADRGWARWERRRMRHAGGWGDDCS
jgi:hypothetical protein